MGSTHACFRVRDLEPSHQDHQVVDPFGEGLTKVFFSRYELLESVGLFAGQPPPSPKAHDELIVL